MIYFSIMFSMIFCLLSYLVMDPMKSSFFLIFSLLFVVSYISFSNFIWMSYFICLLFLSGVFVILVYFSSLSKINFTKSRGVFMSFLISLLMLFFSLSFYFKGVGMNNFYYSFYFFQMLFIIFILVLFLSFSSYFLNFSGALRKV